MNITIQPDTCIRCGRCAAVCPAYVLTQPSPGADINIDLTLRHCITCGQCAAICPTAALRHGAFPADSLPPIHADMLPSPDSLMALLQTRRSCRTFSATPVSEEHLQQILTAATYAPTATNAQDVSYTVVRTQDMIQQIADYTVQRFAWLLRCLDNPIVRPLVRLLMPGAAAYLPDLRELVHHREHALELIVHRAPLLIFFHAPRGNSMVQANCNLAYQNASLMAQSLGVGQFYLGFVVTVALQFDPFRRLGRLLGTQDGIYAAMALGMPRLPYAHSIKRPSRTVHYR